MAELIKIGSFATQDYAQLIPLAMRCTTLGNVSTPRKMGQSSGYQVTAGKSLYIVRMLVTFNNNTTGNNGISFGYADNDVGMDTTTARTTPVAIFGNPESNTQAAIGLGMLAMTAGPNVWDFSGLWGPIPAAKYPYAMFVGFSGTVTTVHMWGIEK